MTNKVDTYVEESVPYNKSKLWDIHNHYYAKKGLDAWEPGGVPYTSTNNFAIAKQHARFITDVYSRELQSQKRTTDDPFYVLELGSGLGIFAANLLKALHTECGPTGQKLATVLTYIFSDNQPETVMAAVQSDQLCDFRHQLVPAHFDVNDFSLTSLGDQKVPERVDYVLANYVCCVTPTKLLRFDTNSWHEQYAQVQLTPAEFQSTLESTTERSDVLKNLPVAYQWNEIDLHTLGKEHASLLETFQTGNETSIFNYPCAFITFIQNISQILTPGGHIMISDFGYSALEKNLNTTDNLRFIYGNTLNHSVHFGLFKTLAERLNWSFSATHTPVRSLHHACISTSPASSPAVATSFYKNFERSFAGEDLQVFWMLAQESLQSEHYPRAAHFAARCITLDPSEKCYYETAIQALHKSGRTEAAHHYEQLQKQAGL